jgi:micrococcal nuclease
MCQRFGIWTRVKGKSEVAQPGLYSINHFIDGDTISVNMNGAAQSIRLIGVDTPETHKPNMPVQCYGEAAAAFTKATIGNDRVRLIADSESDDRDVYGRLVRYVYLPDGRDLDELLVQNGYGFAYIYFPFTRSAQFASDQITAQKQHKGLWGACHPYQEPDGRWQTETAAPT